MPHTSDRRLWLTADKNTVVEDGDERAAFLLASEGSEIPNDEWQRLGLRQEDFKVVLPGADEAQPAAAEEQPSGTVQEGALTYINQTADEAAAQQQPEEAAPAQQFQAASAEVAAAAEEPAAEPGSEEAEGPGGRSRRSR